MRILAVDPGGTTGWARLDTTSGAFDSGVVKGHEWEHADYVVGEVLAGRVDRLVIEDFNLRVSLSRGAASKRDTLSPVRVTEQITYGLYREVKRQQRALSGGTSVASRWALDARWATSPGAQGGLVVIQSGADAMGFATDERLRRWGMYVTPIHARDAMRHAVLYAARHKADEAQASDEVASAGRRAARPRGVTDVSRGARVKGTRRRR